MRNAVPQIVFTGHLDMAMEIFERFPVKENKSLHTHGGFVGQALGNFSGSPEKCAEIAVR